jgi:uncharacterized membrane protein YdbT with pleckstrin-like domain
MVFKPLSAFRNKLFLQIALIWAVVTTSISAFVWFIDFVTKFDTDNSSDGFRNFLVTYFGDVVLWYLVISLIICFIGALVTIIYTRSMEFQIWGHEVVVKKGVVNKTEKHVPYRTVTNISARYGIFDRLFGIGTVEIQTAGRSGQSTAPEEKIEGIRNFFEIRDIVLIEIRKFRTQYATGTEIPVPIAKTEAVSSAILQELKEIKNLLAKK